MGHGMGLESQEKATSHCVWMSTFIGICQSSVLGNSTTIEACEWKTWEWFDENTILAYMHVYNYNYNVEDQYYSNHSIRTMGPSCLTQKTHTPSGRTTESLLYAQDSETLVMFCNAARPIGAFECFMLVRATIAKQLDASGFVGPQLKFIFQTTLKMLILFITGWRDPILDREVALWLG